MADDVAIRTLPYMYPTVADMVRILRGACMRPCELCALRVGDLDRSGSLFKTRSRHHKTERFGIERFAAFGRAETDILRRYCVGKGMDEFVFSPKQAARERFELRRKRRKTPLTPSQRARDEKREATKYDRYPEQYTTEMLGDAVESALKRAARAGVKIPHWTLYQLRDASVTDISLRRDRETAQLVAGHLSSGTTARYDHKAPLVTAAIAQEREVGWWDVPKTRPPED